MRPPLQLGKFSFRRRVDATWWKIRRRFRSPALYWILAAAVGISTTATVTRLVSDAEAGAARFGDTVVVARAVRDLDAGHRIEPDDIERVELPRSAVADVLADEPEGDRLTHSVGRGEVLAAADVTGGDLSALAAQLDDGRVGVSIQASPASLDTTTGDVVDVWGFDADGLGYRRLTGGAVVIDSNDRAVVVAVDDEDVAEVIAAATDGSAALVLRGADTG